MGYYSELDISKHENELDIIMRDKIKEYEEIHGAFDYYGFKDGEIYGITQEDLDRELEKYEREIDEGRGEYYSLEEVDSILKNEMLRNKMLKKRINIKENNDD